MTSLGNTNYSPRLFGVGPHLTGDPATNRSSLYYPGAFRPEFRDSQDPNQDQSHHFAAFLEIAVLKSPAEARALANAIDAHPFAGLDNIGDINLGTVAADLGRALLDGSLGLSGIGDWIRQNICNQNLQ